MDSRQGVYYSQYIIDMGDVDATTLGADGWWKYNSATGITAVQPIDPSLDVALYNLNSPAATVTITDAGAVTIAADTGSSITVTPGTSGGTFKFGSSGALQWQVSGGDLIPITTLTPSLGNASFQVKKIFAGEIAATQYTTPTTTLTAATTVTSAQGGAFLLDTTTVGSFTVTLFNPASKGSMEIGPFWNSGAGIATLASSGGTPKFIRKDGTTAATIAIAAGTVIGKLKSMLGNGVTSWVEY